MKKNPIKVSVIMPVFNVSLYLRPSLDSILSQTLSDIEVIAVDDGSTDGSFDILESYALRDDRVMVLHNGEPSAGAAGARNFGIRFAQGEYISVLDADDFFEKDMLEKAYCKAKETGADVVLYDGYRYDDKKGIDLKRSSILITGQIPPGKGCFAPWENSDRLFSMTLGAAWNVLFLRMLIRDHHLSFRGFMHGDDFEFVFMAFVHADRIAVLNERLVHYRVNRKGSLSDGISDYPLTCAESLLSFKGHLIADGQYERFRIGFVNFAASYIAFYLKSMTDIHNLRTLYNSLRDRYLSLLGLAKPGVPDLDGQDIKDVRLRELINMIKKEPLEEYLFCRMRKQFPFDETVSWKKTIPSGTRIVLYGADRNGLDVFHTIFWNLDYEVVLWVDEAHEKLGFPISAPEEIADVETDYVLITYLSKPLQEAALSELVKLGIDADKVICIGE